MKSLRNLEDYKSYKKPKKRRFMNEIKGLRGYLQIDYKLRQVSGIIGDFLFSGIR